MIGLEVRLIGADDGIELHREFLDTIQSAMTNGNWGLSPERMRAWLAAKNPAPSKRNLRDFWKPSFWRRDEAPAPKSVSDLLAEQWHDTSLDDGPPSLEVARIVEDFFVKDGVMNASAKARLSELLEKHEQVQMLVHDWSHDPAIVDDAELVAKIIQLQHPALQKILDGGHQRRTVRSFLIESGLCDRRTRSLGRFSH